MKMHKTFTRIPQRSYEAFVGNFNPPLFNPTLHQTLAALAVDPLEAEDAWKIFGVDGIPHSLENFADRGRVAYRQALETISQWVMTRSSADIAMGEIAAYDSRLEVWLSCAVAREALPLAQKNDDRPLKAIETAERWVIGRATPAECGAASDAADASSTENYAIGEAMYPVRYDRRAMAAAGLASAAMESARAAMENNQFGAQNAMDVAMAYASAKADPGASAWNDTRVAELYRLREVVAAACLSYPVIP